jgi:hypothetical protein
MAQLFHLSSSNVSDTFHKMVQTEGGKFADASGSTISFILASQTGSMTVLSASYAVTSSHEVILEVSSSYAESASHANIANDLSGLTTNEIIEAFDGISYAPTTGVITMTKITGDTSPIDIGVGTADSPSFQRLTLTSPGALGSPVINLPGEATAANPHMMTRSDTESGPSLFMLDGVGDAGLIAQSGLISFVNQSVEIVAGINQAGVITANKFSSTGDVHTTGSIWTKTNVTASGNISASGQLYAQGFYGKSDSRIYPGGSSYGFIAANANSITINGGSLNVGSHITASGHISASGHIIGQHLLAYGEQATQIGAISRVGSGVNAIKGRLTLNDGDELTTNISSISDSYISGSNAQLGIGTKTPSASLHVLGNVFASGPAGHITASGNISSSGNIMAGAVGTMSAYTGSFGQVSASGNIITTGNVIADNIIIGDGGYIRPATAGGDITFSPYSHGSQELLLMNADTFDVKMDAKLALGITPTTFNVNGGHNPGHQFKVDHTDGQLAIYTEADTSRLKLRGLTSIILSGSATSPNADVFSPYLTKTALLVSGSQANIGDLSIAGHVTASGNISSSGNIIGNEIQTHTIDTAPGATNVSINSGLYVDGFLTIQNGNTFRTSGDVELGDAIDDTIKIDGHVTASGNISASGEIISTGNITTDGTVTATSFVGAPVVLEHLNIYANNVAGPGEVGHPDFRYGSGTGVEAGTWTSTLADPTAPTAPQLLNGFIMPFNKMKNIQVKASVRSQGSGIPTLWMYTGSRVNGTDAFDLGWAASSSVAVANNNGFYNADMTGSKAWTPNDGDDVLFVYLSNSAANTKQMRFTAVIYGYTAE